MQIKAKHEIRSTLALFGLNFSDLARESRIPTGLLNHYINNRRNPTPEKLERLKEAYKELTGYTLPSLKEDHKNK